MSEQPSWRRSLKVGLIWGGIAVFLSMVGMIDTFAARQVIAGIISLGSGLLLLTGLAAGYQAAQWRDGSGRAAAVLRGMLAGCLVGAATAALVALASVVNLRAVFVSATPSLFLLLSLGRGVAGAYLPPLVGAVVGAVGALGAVVNPRIRRPLVMGFIWVLSLGVFQELITTVLPEEGLRGFIRERLFETEGLSWIGAVVIFAVACAATAVWAGRRATAVRWFGARSASQQRGLRWLAFGVGAVILMFIPSAAGPFLSQVLVLVGLFALLGLGLNIVVGFAGLLDLGYVAFFAIGAYVVGLLTSTAEYGILHLSFWSAVPVAMVVSMIAGVLLGIPVLRIRGDYLAIATLGFGEIIRILVLSDFLRPWLGGSQGVLAIPKPTIGGFEFSGPEQLFYLTLAFSVVVVIVASRLRDSRLGRAWMAVREDEDVAEALGINLVNVKLLAFGLGATFAGLSGAIFAVMIGSVFPHSFQLLISINVLALIIVGGMGSMPGVIVGALFLIGLPELLREFAEFRYLVYGAALVVMMQLRPEGLWPAPAIRRELHAVDERETAPAVAVSVGPGRAGDA
jgi:branched-chain amino acid transport system permease protein